MHQRFGILLLLIGFQGTLTAQHSKETVVAPFGFDSVEGPASIGAGAPPKFRFQWQYDSQWFPQEPIEITELAFRRNKQTLDQEVTFPGLEVALSTQAADLGTRFRDNIGEDEQVVFVGDLVQALPADATPRPFDVVVPFASPFSFDASHGDLLVDFRAKQGVDAAPFWDGVAGAHGHVTFGFDVSDSAIGFSENVLPVVQFTYSPVGPSLDCNLDGAVSIMDANCVDAATLTRLLDSMDVVLGDLDGDGAVDMGDFLALSSHFGMEATYTEGDLDLNGRVEFVDFLTLASNFGSATVAAVPEPSSSLLLTTLALIFMGCRGTAIDILEIGNVRRRSQ